MREHWPRGKTRVESFACAAPSHFASPEYASTQIKIVPHELARAHELQFLRDGARRLRHGGSVLTFRLAGEWAKFHSARSLLRVRLDAYAAVAANDLAANHVLCR